MIAATFVREFVALVALSHPVLQDTTPVVAVFLHKDCITFLHEDTSTTSTGVANFLEFLPASRGCDTDDNPSALGTDYYEAEWIDANNVTHRVRTLRSSGRSAGSNARLHAEAVRAMQEVFPPRAVTPRE